MTKSLKSVSPTFQDPLHALQTQLDPNGPFLDDDHDTPALPIAHIRALQESVREYEMDEDGKHPDKWMHMLIAPDSSLGGARPKANIVDTNGNLCIAKFPSKSDTTDMVAWEYLAYRLGEKAGLTPRSCNLLKYMARTTHSCPGDLIVLEMKEYILHLR